MILKSRIVMPITTPLIEGGAVVIEAGRISAVGRWSDISSQAGQHQVLDLGECVLLPGLVNAHCHLDYTAMGGMIEPLKSFTDWIKSITTLKAGMDYADYAKSWLDGAQMLLRTGTTTVGDIEAVPELLPDVWQSTSLRVLSFLEMTGVKSRRQPDLILKDAVDKIGSLESHQSSAHLSPHAPYSTTPELLRLSGHTARARGYRLSTHVAESEEEFEMFLYGRGVMYEWLKRNDRDMSDCGSRSPVQHLVHNDLLGENLLAIHVNYLWQGDAELLGKQQANVVHCPRSHEYFRHHRFPRKELRQAGVNICLGTDSLTTVLKKRGEPLELNMFREMQTMIALSPDLAPEELLRMATVNGARALGLFGQTGELSSGTNADLIAVPFSGQVVNSYDAVVQHLGPVAASMIRGEWALKPPHI